MVHIYKADRIHTPTIKEHCTVCALLGLLLLLLLLLI